MYNKISKGLFKKHVQLFCPPPLAIATNGKCDALWDNLDNLDDLQNIINSIV